MSNSENPKVFKSVTLVSLLPGGRQFALTLPEKMSAKDWEFLQQYIDLWRSGDEYVEPEAIDAAPPGASVTGG